MIRQPRPALAVLVGLVVVFASACSSSGNTFPAGPTGGAGGTSAPTSAASAAATVNLSDPNSLITQLINGGPAVTSFHINIAVTGTIKAAALSSAAGSAGGILTGDLKLDGTTIDGDVDVANQAAHISLNVPPLAALGNLPLTGDLILKDNVLYYQVSLLGTKYTEMDLSSLGASLGSLASTLPVAVPTPGASALAGVADEVAQVRQQLQAAGFAAKLVGVEQVDGKNAYHISISLPLDAINSDIAAAAASAAPGMKLDSASVDIWTYTDNYQLAKIQIQGASSTVGSLGITVTITNYGVPVTIAAPSASEIESSAP